jgi:hypothetical protein
VHRTRSPHHAAAALGRLQRGRGAGARGTRSHARAPSSRPRRPLQRCSAVPPEDRRGTAPRAGETRGLGGRRDDPGVRTRGRCLDVSRDPRHPSQRRGPPGRPGGPPAGSAVAGPPRPGGGEGGAEGHVDGQESSCGTRAGPAPPEDRFDQRTEGEHGAQHSQRRRGVPRCKRRAGERGNRRRETRAPEHEDERTPHVERAAEPQRLPSDAVTDCDHGPYRVDGDQRGDDPRTSIPHLRSMPSPRSPSGPTRARHVGVVSTGRRRPRPGSRRDAAPSSMPGGGRS